LGAMPPAASRKRVPSDSPASEPPPKRTRNAPARRNKESVFQTLDAPPTTKRTLSQTKAFLERADDDSELSEPGSSSDDNFEDVPLNKGKAKARVNEDDDSGDENWEDALGGQQDGDHGPVPVISGDIALTLSAAPKTAFDTKPDGRKGPSKIQREIRNATHCMHMQYLMFHNLIRNAWIQDKEVQKIVVEALPAKSWQIVERYWKDAGITDGPSRTVATRRKIAKKEKAKSKAKETHAKSRSARDWGAASAPLEPNMPNMSAGDPLRGLVGQLAYSWNKSFTVTAPRLRKRGYLSPTTLEAEINAWKEDPSHPGTFGERIENLDAFRELARRREGSNDVSQQLFTALLRGLGIEARMVVSLQPVGFGFSQVEEGKPKNLEKLEDAVKVPTLKTPASHKPGQAQSPMLKNKEKLIIDASNDSDLSSAISISSGSEQEQAKKKTAKARPRREELLYPTYWTEAISHLTHTPFAISSGPDHSLAHHHLPHPFKDFYARGAAADNARQVFAYLVAFSSDGTAKDVTTRYLPKHQWPGRTKGFRMGVEKTPIYNKRGKVKRWEEWDWLQALMSSYARPHNKRQPWDEVEDEGDLVPAEPERKKTMDEEGGKETLQGYKNSAQYVLERHLRREEALRRGAKIVRHFVTGKGDKETTEPVYRRKDVVNCKTVESWHKEGREVKQGEQPLKMVPMRAVTVTRKREIEEREREEGGKVKQGLYSKAQTDWIIPDPIVDGKIPRNSFNNIDIYVPTMVPKGAVHIPLKGTARICRKLNIEHAEACTGFEFGKQRAVPVLTGVVVSVENEDLVIDAWRVDEAEKAKKEAEKREKLLLGLWRKFFSGLRIVERMKAEYGEDVEIPPKKATAPPSKEKPEQERSQWELFQDHEDFEGGFLREDGPPGGEFVRGEIPERLEGDHMAGGFFASQDEPVHGDLTIEHSDGVAEKRTTVVETAYQTPISLTSAAQQPVDESSDEEDQNEKTALDRAEETDEEAPLEPPASRRKSTTAQPSRGRGRGRAGKPTPAPTRKRKPVVESSDDAESSLSDAASDPPTPPPSIRSAPKRKAARKSDAQVKSHFFANSSAAETDLTDMTDRASPKKKAAMRGKGKTAKGRGRGKAKA
jgi:xeroderma pigmentosum group C-complementing protein